MGTTTTEALTGKKADSRERQHLPNTFIYVHAFMGIISVCFDVYWLFFHYICQVQFQMFTLTRCGSRALKLGCKVQVQQ